MLLRLGELFSGPGGGAYAAKQARITDRNGNLWGYTHVWANDFDKDAVNTYRANLLQKENYSSVICEDVHTLDMSSLGDIDVLMFGFPCNDFSTIGKQKGINGIYGPLYTYGVKALKKFKPKVFIAENVSGLTSANSGNAYKLILKSLEDAGYTITPHLYKFEQYGVPQARHRIIIVGIRNDLASQGIVFKVPEPTIKDPSQYKTAGQALTDPPIAANAYNNEMPHHREQTKKFLSYIPEGGNAWSSSIPKSLRLNVKGAKLSNIYKRLSYNKPAYTVTGSGGGGTSMYHWKENRALTNRERARLQTFPDDYRFIGSQQSVKRQIGMAIPPKGMEIILKSVLRCLASKQALI